MSKKLYMNPTSEVMDLRAMKAMMDETPLVGPSSVPGDPFNDPFNAAPGRTDKAF